MGSSDVIGYDGIVVVVGRIIHHPRNDPDCNQDLYSKDRNLR